MKKTGRTPPLGLRQKNKLDKLRRIKSAAAELFSKKGFDEATTRDIANRAHVGKGTIFLYAKDKRALVFLLYDEELNTIRSNALKRIKPDSPPLEQLVSMLSVFYEEFAKNVVLSRIMLKELLFYQGPHEKDHRPHGLRVIFDIAELVSQAQKNGSIGSTEDPFWIANYIYNTHQGALRAWLWHDDPKVAEGVAALRRLLFLVFQGLESVTSERNDRKPKLVS